MKDFLAKFAKLAIVKSVKILLNRFKIVLNSRQYVLHLLQPVEKIDNNVNNSTS